MYYDVFNGDADGIIALLQWRLAYPVTDGQQHMLVTGVKRDIALLGKFEARQGDSVTVLDISMEKNHEALAVHLQHGAKVFYADHHRAGDIPEHEMLDAHIDLDANTCTALIVDGLLQGQYHHWAITAAYGDNLIAKGDELAKVADLSAEQAAQLKELGTLINYNGYGSTVADLHFAPDALFTALLQYTSPFDVIADQSSPFYQLKAAYEQDMANAKAISPMHQSPTLTVIELPDEAWARRISGVFGNLLANNAPNSAHAVFTMNKDKTYTVSLRAPLNNKQGAGDICSQFATGGGRAAAAGVNALDKNDIGHFIEAVESYYG
ncbi:DHH family phosphoesterase [Thalassotalea ponticola]|uniref:DHHA1 domain-containing protein n=1 Tax=Thalassotalea ponticola TaxID=1523392 RepID=UPI0025B4AE1B|nr:DHH family phosphoesterase [Thalassotalea ponticola]MDN3652669.1 DHH family phosphoesterase [Thalassotalea ponticola]